MKYGFGVDVGGTTIKIAFFDQDGTMLGQWEIPTNTKDSGTNILPDISDSINCFLNKETVAKEKIMGIGLGVPGPVNETGVVNKCVNLGWDVLDVHAELSRLTGLPIKAGNDANIAALGEYWKGGAQGCENFVMVTLGTGIGGAIVMKGEFVNGEHAAGGEIGHMLLKPDETEPCNCGKCGCAEQYCSATGIIRIAKHFLAEYTNDSALRRKDPLECKHVFEEAEKGDLLAIGILEEVYKYLGLLLTNICCVTDPELILLGGGVSKAGVPLIEGTTKYFQRYAFHACRSTKIKAAMLGNDAGVYGAFRLLLDSIENKA